MHLAVLRDGRELPYVERGDPDGVAVVLLHAWLDSLRCFDQLMAALPERIRAVAFDQRGHGDAAKPADGYGLRDFADDIGAFMDAVGLDAAVLAGRGGVDAALEALAPGGTVLVFADAGPLPAHRVYRRELTIVGSRSATAGSMREALALRPQLDVPEPTVLPLERFAEGVDLFRRRDALKVVFTP